MVHIQVIIDRFEVSEFKSEWYVMASKQKS